MHIRSLLFLGICASLGLSASAYAETPPQKTYLFPKTVKAAEVDAKQEKLPIKKPNGKQQAKKDEKKAKQDLISRPAP